MKIIRIKTILFAIIFLAAILRFYNISNLPPSLGWDEAALGYNAYSLSIDGRDEFGRRLPLDYLESFGDFKPPMYSYLALIPVKLFGLNEFGVRFPSALFGTISVLLTFFVVREVFRNDGLALLSSLFLAISPWHIMLSRGAFEANVASFFIILGTLLFLIALKRKPVFLVFSAVSFALSLYTFNSARVFVPVFTMTLGLIFLKELLKIKKELVLSIIVGVIILIPLANFLFSSQASLRYKEVNIFSDSNIVKISNQEIANITSKQITDIQAIKSRHTKTSKAFKEIFGEFVITTRK